MNRTKQAIQDTFWELLEEKPFAKITVRDIVERCEVNRNTFYYHFRDIPDLAESSARDWVDRVISSHGEYGSPMNCLRPIAEECTRRKRAVLNIYRSAQRDILMRGLNELCEYFIQAYIEQVGSEISIHPEAREMLLRLSKCTLSGLLLDWLESGGSYDLESYFEGILLLRGVLDRYQQPSPDARLRIPPERS